VNAITAEARTALRAAFANARLTDAEARAIAYGKYDPSRTPIRSLDHASDYVLANTNGALLEALTNDDHVMAALVSGDASTLVAERQRVVDETIEAVLRGRS
jgi:hypothetical protein